MTLDYTNYFLNHHLIIIVTFNVKQSGLLAHNLTPDPLFLVLTLPPHLHPSLPNCLFPSDLYLPCMLRDRFISFSEVVTRSIKVDGNDVTGKRESGLSIGMVRVLEKERRQRQTLQCFMIYFTKRNADPQAKEDMMLRRFVRFISRIQSFKVTQYSTMNLCCRHLKPYFTVNCGILYLPLFTGNFSQTSVIN